MRIVGIIVAIVAMLIGIGSNLPAMVDIPSLIIVLGGTIGMLLLGGSPIPLMVSAIFSVPESPADAAAAAKGWKMARIYSLGSGVIGSVIGWVIILKNFDDPAAIGPGMAISLLTLFWALVFAYILCLPCQANAEKGFDGPTDDSAMASGILSILFVSFVSLSCFGILVMSFSSAK